ncbi:hypothetical protein VTK56DRAFT_1441 [Thermocarpiscus australiensis]
MTAHKLNVLDTMHSGIARHLFTYHSERKCLLIRGDRGTSNRETKGPLPRALTSRATNAKDLRISTGHL